MPEEFQNQEEAPLNKNALAAVVAGILVIIAGFLVYNYFTKAGKISEKAVTIEEQTASEETGEKSKESELKVEEKKQGEIAGKTTEKKQEKKLEAPKPKQPQTTKWTANDIQPNTVKGGKYTVKKGDTLWEIAEGRYGSGFQWRKILEANKDKVGFLANGSQALIEVGQELVLPD